MKSALDALPCSVTELCACVAAPTMGAEAPVKGDTMVAPAPIPCMLPMGAKAYGFPRCWVTQRVRGSAPTVGRKKRLEAT